MSADRITASIGHRLRMTVMALRSQPGSSPVLVRYQEARSSVIASSSRTEDVVVEPDERRFDELRNFGAVMPS